MIGKSEVKTRTRYKKEQKKKKKQIKFGQMHFHPFILEYLYRAFQITVLYTHRIIIIRLILRVEMSVSICSIN